MMQSNVIEKKRCWGKNYKWILYYNKEIQAKGITYTEARELEAQMTKKGYNRLLFAILPNQKSKR